MKSGIVEHYLYFFKTNISFLEKQVTYLLVGKNFTIISLENTCWGIALTEHQHCCIQPEEQMTFFKAFQRPSVKWLIDHIELTPYANSIICALANAWLYQKIKSGLLTVDNKDPLELVDLKDKKITMVGYFQHYARYFEEQKIEWYVIEKEPEQIDPLHFHRFFSYEKEEWKNIICQSDINIITGSTIVNNTLPNILKHIKPTAINILTGPTAGGIPEVLSSYPLHIIATSLVTSPSKAKKLTALGAPGFIYFKLNALSKICLTI